MKFQGTGNSYATSGPNHIASVWSDSNQIELAHDDKAPPSGLMLFWNRAGSRLITTGGFDGMTRVWDVATGESLARLMPQPAGAYSAALSPDENSFLVGTDGRANTRVWDTATGNPVTPLLEHDGPAISCAISDRYYAVATPSGNVFVYPLSRNKMRLDESFLNLAETLGGYVFDANGDLSPLTGTKATLERKNLDWNRIIHSDKE